MQPCQSWLGLLSIRYKDGQLLPLETAKAIARVDPAHWYASVRERRYLISKACVHQQAEVHYHLVDEKDELISFQSFSDAAAFLHEQLGILRVLQRVAV